MQRWWGPPCTAAHCRCSACMDEKNHFHLTKGEHCCHALRHVRLLVQQPVVGFACMESAMKVTIFTSQRGSTASTCLQQS